MTPERENTGKIIEKERHEILEQLEEWLDLPMLFLSCVWLVLFIVESLWELNPLLDTLQIAIWILFGVDFALEFTLAPSKRSYLKRNWLIVLSLLLPALRIFRFSRALGILRSAQSVRGLRLLQVVTRTNQGMRSLTESFHRRGFSYVVALTVFVLLTSSAGIYVFEREVPETSLTDYGTALWWTAMMITTMGSDYFPQTPEGRLLCLLLAVYAFAMFGYVSASLATFFIGQDTRETSEEAQTREKIEGLQHDLAELRQELQSLLREKINSQL